MQQRRQHVRFTPAKRAAQLQNPVIPRRPGQAGEHLLQKLPEVSGDIGRREERIGVAIHGRVVWFIRRNRPKVDGKHRLGQFSRFHIGMELGYFGPGFQAVDAHAVSLKRQGIPRHSHDT